MRWSGRAEARRSALDDARVGDVARHQVRERDATRAELDQVGLREARGLGRDRLRIARLHVRLGDALHLHEEPDCLAHAVADGQQAVVAQDDRPVVTERVGDAAARHRRLHLHLLVVEDRVIFEEDAALLGDRLDGPHLGRERGPPARVHVTGADRVGARGEDRLVDVVRRRVDDALALDELAVGADEHEVGHRRLVIRHAVAQQPEAVGALGVAGAHVPVAGVAPAHGREDAVAERHLALATRALLRDRVVVAHPFLLRPWHARPTRSGSPRSPSPPPPRTSPRRAGSR